MDGDCGQHPTVTVQSCCAGAKTQSSSWAYPFLQTLAFGYVALALQGRLARLGIKESKSMALLE